MGAMSTDSNDFDYEAPTVPERALFVAADEPLLVFPSVMAAERCLEAIDVENGVYPAAFGPNGEPFTIGTERNRIIIQRTGEPNRPDELKALLLRYLETVGQPADTSMGLHQIAATVWARESDFWREHDPYSDRFAKRIPLWGCIAVVTVAVMGLYFAFR
jgi:hypothetical protein